MPSRRCPSGKVRLKGKCYELDKSNWFYSKPIGVEVKKDVMVQLNHRDGFDNIVVEILQGEQGIYHTMEKHRVDARQPKYQERIDLIMRRAKLFYPQKINDYKWQPARRVR